MKIIRFILGFLFLPALAAGLDLVISNQRIRDIIGIIVMLVLCALCVLFGLIFVDALDENSEIENKKPNCDRESMP